MASGQALAHGGDQHLPELARRPGVHLVGQQHGDAQAVLAVGLVADGPVGALRLRVGDQPPAVDDPRGGRQVRVGPDHAGAAVVGDGGLVAVRGGRDHLAGRVPFRPQQPEQRQRAGERGLAAAARQQQERRADLPQPGVRVDVAEDLADDARLPGVQSEGLAGQRALGVAQLLDEAHRPLAVAQRVGDVALEEAGAGQAAGRTAIMAHALSTTTRTCRGRCARILAGTRHRLNDVLPA